MVLPVPFVVALEEIFIYRIIILDIIRLQKIPDILDAVSYTHLDVYKRQAVEFKDGESEATLSVACPGLQALKSYQFSIHLDAVSYTHLDVYKRQLLHSSIR